MDPHNHPRILLIYPNAGQDVLGINVGLPLSLVYVGTALKSAGYEVTILDQRVQKNFNALLAKEISARPVYVGISSMTGYQINYGLHIAHQIRRLNPEIPIVWGGVHPTIHPESTIRHRWVDYVVINEGEQTAVELAHVLASRADPHTVRGIAFKAEDQVVITPERPQMNVEDLPRLDYGLLDLEDYFTVGHISRLNQLQMVTSRGCPFRCDYCYLTMPQLRGYRWLSAERVYEEVKYLSETYGVKSIFFYDDYFFGNRRRVEALIGMLEEKPLDVQFEVSCRIDFLARESDEFLARMAKAGFTELLIGVESGSDRILKLIKKDFNREQIIRANGKMAKAGITSKLSWLAGFPTETAEDFFQTVDLMLQMQDENPLCSLTPLGIYTPYPGTELYERCKEDYGMKFPETLEEWAEYQWQKNNNLFLNAKELRLLTKLSVASRYFDVKLFERFGQKRYRSLLLLVYYLYGSLIRLRVRKRFFRLMPEVTLLNLLQNYYINSTHKKFLASRESRLAIATPPPTA